MLQPKPDIFSQMRSGKISPIAAPLTKSIFVTKLIKPECGRAADPNSPPLTNPLLAKPRRVGQNL
ncbi:hypothetical protein D0A34_14705 [Microcoleus vaginatus PCC 9802]|nr:hypothetical protein D0A34_14705 [Microcoleus vaginatus PCC 9802]